MSKWRPPGWENDFQENPFVTHIAPELAFEAGADAMLGALCTDENTCEKYEIPVSLNTEGKRGWLVFIPDDEEKALSVQDIKRAMQRLDDAPVPDDKSFLSSLPVSLMPTWLQEWVKKNYPEEKKEGNNG